ncbi:MAG: hypothetical protein ABEJ05_02000 [Haloglomus sp.]
MQVYARTVSRLAPENAILAATAPAVVIVVAAYLVTRVRTRTGTSGVDGETDAAAE